MPLRVAHLIDNLRLAGAQTALRYLVEGLAGRGYHQRVYCLTTLAHPDHLAALRAAGAEVLLLGRAQVFTGVGLARLYRHFRRWQPHIVQTFLPAADLIGRTVAQFAKVPHIVTSIRARNEDKRPLHLWLDRLTMPWAERVVFNTRHAIDFAIAREGVQARQVVYIPNGVPLAPPARPAPLHLPENAAVIGTVGRLKPQKGHIHLIRAFARVRAAVPQAELIVVGSGPLQPELAAEAARLGAAAHVHFLGERDDVSALYPAFDVYAHPALFEGMPNAVMEAMAAGLPVVATEVDGARELIRDGETGWLVPAGDAGLLAARLAGALASPAEARRLGEAARRYVEENFSIGKMVEAWDALYREIAG
jgi:glycosyltransferase involved in cell wall biosynthesis